MRAEGLVKSFGKTKALDGVDLEIPAGTILGLLGPNGAGKTTMVRVLTTLLRPDAGRAWVAGHEVAAEPQAVRRSIGLSGQYAAVDENLTGYENLYLVGRLYGFGRRKARERSRELLDRFRLDEAADRPAKGYSGGMRRRLDLAGALVAQPPVVVLDEPTTGLDPRGRLDTWAMISELVTDGATVLLTTQYLEEADQLADSIVVIDKGRAIARGTADELKARIGGERLQLIVTQPEQLARATAILAEVGSGPPVVDEGVRRLAVPVEGGTKALVEALRRFDAEGIEVQDVASSRPTLDDVFLALTGHAAETSETEEDK
ncbi:daunorubicin resistance protein DrrA family ABC transporter ATP-binding protein [Pseudonocardia ailaonensis]|uniref:Daunorubicin resistance protein DrrA family ABC transporter ATP-binding protein n=1 Tax=Pseudonocardia ailaonensis TaxID=367279 RepID=A0ABN2NHX6_9PSEU